MCRKWHWAVGTPKQLAAVCSRYQIGVMVVRKKIDSTTIHYITHSEVAYVIDSTGHQRALFRLAVLLAEGRGARPTRRPALSAWRIAQPGCRPAGRHPG